MKAKSGGSVKAKSKGEYRTAEYRLSNYEVKAKSKAWDADCDDLRGEKS